MVVPEVRTTGIAETRPARPTGDGVLEEMKIVHLSIFDKGMWRTSGFSLSTSLGVAETRRAPRSQLPRRYRP